jgi:hypothetical protein
VLRYAARVPSPAPLAHPLRTIWGGLLVAHVVAGACAAWLLPHGFPLLHPRTVLGVFAPGAIVTSSLCLALLMVFAPRRATRWLPALPALWSSLALALLLIFPETGWVAARTLGLCALPLALLAWLSCRGTRVRTLLPAVLSGAALGQLTAFCEKPEPASTRPWRAVPPQLGNEEHAPVPERWELAPDLVVEGQSARVTWQGHRATVSITPVLTFDRTSPDGFWSIFAPAASAVSPTKATAAHDELRLWSSDGALLLRVSRDLTLPGEPTLGLQLESYTRLARPVYSHLNAFTTVTVSRHRRLGLRFSPCPSALIAVTHSDYPSGAPARFAYVDAAHRFHVVQAADAEKGPFASLAEGAFLRDETLGIDLVELDPPESAIARLELSDFENQLSTALSPTAGYGVPVNAIQFGLESTEASSPAHLIFTLAATGVGRGWDSVAHAAGTYTNRMTLRSLERPAAQTETIPLHDVTPSCAAIAREIAGLAPRYPQLRDFDANGVSSSPGECTISYAYRTHRSTVRGGWVAQVPNPDPDGIWFHIGIWDPRGPARRSQINTQPGGAVHAFGDDHITFLTLEGRSARPLRPALWKILEKHGLGAVIH